MIFAVLTLGSCSPTHVVYLLNVSSVLDFFRDFKQHSTCALLHAWSGLGRSADGAYINSAPIGEQHFILGAFPSKIWPFEMVQIP